MPIRHRKGSRMRSGRMFTAGSPPHKASPLPDLTSSFSSGGSSATPNSPDHRRRVESSMHRSRELTGSSPRKSLDSRRDIDNVRRGAEIIREQILAQQQQNKVDENACLGDDPRWSGNPSPPLSTHRQARKVQPVQPQKDIVEDVFALEEEMRLLRMRVRSGELSRGGYLYDNDSSGQENDRDDKKVDCEMRQHGERNRSYKQSGPSERDSGSNERSHVVHDERVVSSPFQSGSHKAPPDPPSTCEGIRPESIVGRNSSFATASRADNASHKLFEGEGSSPLSPSQDEAAGFGTSYLPGSLMSTREKSFSQESIPSEVNVVKDKAYLHATNAGVLWQTLVGEQIRFPSHWFGGARTPHLTGDKFSDDPNGGQSSSSGRRWSYVAHCRVRGDPDLNRWIRNRSKPGKVLLHIVVRDTVKWQPIRHIAIGCFHPNARGIRRTQDPIPEDEKVREVWMAVRRCRDHHLGGENQRDASRWTSQLDTVLMQGMPLNKVGMPSPLGDKHSVDNSNVRAVFGDEAPRETVFILENDLYNILSDAADDQGNRGLQDFSTLLTLLDQFVFNQQR